jgi:hypothetical protein
MATLAFSSAINSNEFRHLLSVFNNASVGNNRSKIEEMTECMRLLKSRLDSAQTLVYLAQQHFPLLAIQLSNGLRAVVTALSPSTLDILDARTTFDELSQLNIERRPKPLSASSPNHASVVVLVQIEGNNMLLAADRQDRKHPGRGWEVIVNNPVANQAPADTLKIAHHGSPNGFYPGIWPGLVAPTCIGIVTPFTQNHLPETDTIKQYLSKGVQLFTTAWPHAVARWRLSLPPAVKIGRPRSVRPGIVRLRKRIRGGGWETELFGGAMKVDEALLWDVRRSVSACPLLRPAPA